LSCPGVHVGIRQPSAELPYAQLELPTVRTAFALSHQVLLDQYAYFAIVRALSAQSEDRSDKTPGTGKAVCGRDLTLLTIED
jgi:hypothetical protein